MRRALTTCSPLTSLAVAACVSTGSYTRLGSLESNARHDDATLDDLEDRIDRFERSVEEVVHLYEKAGHQLDHARKQYELARRIANEASNSFKVASQNYKEAERNYKLVTIMLLAVAQWDFAGHLCATRMTTSQYRRMLRKDGIELEGLDADHGLPRSFGGADHPLNYRMIESSLNRSLGNNVTRKLMAHPIHLLQGATISAMLRLRCAPQL